MDERTTLREALEGCIRAMELVAQDPASPSTMEWLRKPYIAARAAIAATPTGLAAAAPDLLALAKHILALETDPYLQGHPEWEAFLNEAKAAENKAEGR